MLKLFYSTVEIKSLCLSVPLKLISLNGQVIDTVGDADAGVCLRKALDWQTG